MLLLASIISVILLIWFSLFIFNRCCDNKNQRKKKRKECFVEHLEPTAKGQIMLTDPNGNFSTFDVGTDKTLVSDGAGNITTVQTGLFNGAITANAGITASTGTFTSNINSNGSINSEKIVSASKAGAGSAAIVAVAGTANTTGVINFNYSNGARKSYIGGEDAANPTYTELTADGADGFSTNKNFIVKGQITGNLTGNSTTTDRLRLFDTRNDNSPPSYYASKPGLTYEFKIAATIGISGLNGFILLQTLVPWSDNSGGLSMQQTATIGKEKYTRYAMPQDTKWGEWENQYYNSFTTVSSPDTTFTPASAWTKNEGASMWDDAIRSPYLGVLYLTSVEGDTSALGNNIDIVVPVGMRTGYVHYLSWTGCRYFDICGIKNNTEIFIKRINSYQATASSDSGSGYHSGISISAIPRVDRYSKIRIKGIKGQIYYMGMAWNNDVVSSDNTGFLNTDNLVGNFSSGLTSSGQITVDGGMNINSKYGKINGADAGRLNIYNDRASTAGWTHFSWNNGENFIQGKTKFRGDPTPLCINDTCISEDDLKNLKKLGGVIQGLGHMGRNLRSRDMYNAGVGYCDLGGIC